MTHDGSTYTDTHQIGGTLTSHARIEPLIDAEGAYIPGTEAYYSFAGEDNKTWLLDAAEDGGVGALIDAARPIMYFSFQGNVITGYTGGFEISTLVLPKTYDGNALTQIGDGEHALFDNPAGTITVTVTENTQRVAANAFKDLSSLKTFNGDTSNLTEIGADAFTGSGVTALTLSAERIIGIADNAFANNVQISALHASALGEGAHGGQYTVAYTDHEYVIQSTDWNSNPPAITIRCMKPGCSEEHTIPATVTEKTEDDHTVKTATATFEGIEYIDEDNVYQVILKAGLGGGDDKTLPITGNSYTLPATADDFAAPTGAELKGWQDQDGTDYALGENCTLSGNKVFIAQWESTWAEVSKALEAGQAFKLLNSITAADTDGSLTIPAGKTASLNLNGYSIDRGLAEKDAEAGGSVFTLGDGAALNLFGNGGTITGGNNTGDGGGFYLPKNATLLVANINISGNASASRGGAAYMGEGSTVTTNSNNAAYWGIGIGLGAVGGAAYLIYNQAFKGGGCFIDQGGKLEIGNGVEILDNAGPGSGTEVNYDNVDVAEDGGQQGGQQGGDGSAIGVSSGTLAKLVLGGLIATGLGLGIKFFVDGKDNKPQDHDEGNPPQERQKDKKDNCKHTEYEVTWAWDEETYATAALTATYKQCGNTITEKINSEAALDENTQTWKYTVSKYGSTETKEVLPYKVKLHTGYEQIKGALVAANDETATAVLNEINAKIGELNAENPQDVIVNVPHRQGQPGSLASPAMPTGTIWQALTEYYKFGGWKPFNHTQTFQDEKTKMQIKTDLDFFGEWKVEVEYKKNSPTEEKGITPITESLPFGAVHNLRKNPFTRDYYDFDGWRVVMGGVTVNKPVNQLEPNGARKGMTEGSPVVVFARTVVTPQWKSKWSKLNEKMNGNLFSMDAVDPSLGSSEILDSDVKAMQGDSTQAVKHNFFLDLKGRVLDRSLQTVVGSETQILGGSVISVKAGVLTVMDGRAKTNQPGGITGGSTVGANGGGVSVTDAGRFILNGATIQLNKDVLGMGTNGGAGGGVYVKASNGNEINRAVPMFEFKAGSILGNSAVSGGGVYVGEKTYALMSDGTISGNTAANAGGGVYVDRDAIFQMKGGTISKNAATNSGGGVHVAGTMEISGKINITGNTGANVYLCEDKVLTVTDTLNASTRIGVTTQTAPKTGAPVVFTHGLKDKGNAANFISDDSAYIVRINDQGEAALYLPFSVSFDNNGGTGKMDSEQVILNEQYKLPEHRFGAPEGKGFAGWDIVVNNVDTGEVKQPGEKIEINANTLLRARWAEEFTVTFDSDGGSAVAAQTVFLGKFAAEPEMPTKQGYTFVRWELNGEEFSFYTPVNRNLTLKAKWAEGTVPAFRTHALVLSGEIGVTFYMQLPNGVDYSDSTMEFDIGGNRTAKAGYDPNNKNKDGNYYGFTCFVNSVEMADTITATFRYGDNKSVWQTYSVVQYVDEFNVKAESFPAQTQNLVKALADYGHYMQLFLANANNWALGENGRHRVMPEANSISDAEITQIKDKTQAFAISRDVTGTDINKITYSLYLDSKISIYLYLKMNDGYSGAAPTAKDGDKNFRVAKMSDSRYRVVIPNIKASQLGTNNKVVITAGDKSCTVTVSPLSYVYTVLTNTGSYDPSAKAAMASLYKYYIAAVAQNNLQSGQ